MYSDFDDNTSQVQILDPVTSSLISVFCHFVSIKQQEETNNY